jgi:hypothetical protein
VGACAVGVSSARAQTAAGEITGLVKDQAGAAVTGATITVTETRTNLQRVVVSTRDGVYTVASLVPGEYRLDIALAGFKSVRREGVRLATGEKARIDFDLAVGSLQEQITVVGDAPIVRAETASLGTVVENEQVVRLPLNGRLFIMLASIVPGVALPPNSAFPRINGGRPRTNEYLFDGISVLQPEPGQVAYYPVIDAIQEFKIESNSPPAEFGRFNGGVVNLTTKSGSNTLHGNVFEFFRNEHLNARNYFQTSNAVKPDYRRNQYGGMLGGPVVKDRTFFFADFQGQRQNIGRTVTSNVPTLAERSGVFRQNIYDPATTVGNTRQQFANNTIPRGAMDPVALALLERFPLPTNSATANNYTRTGNEIVNQDQGEARLDHKFASNRDQAFGRLTYFREHAVPVTAFPDGSGTYSSRQRRGRSAGHEGMGVRLELSTHLLDQSAERSPHRRYTAIRSAERGVVVLGGGGRAEHSRHPIECKIPQHAADLRAQWLPADRLPDEYGFGLQHQRVGGRRFVDVAERPPHIQNGPRLALGTAQRDPASLADRIVCLHYRRQRSPGSREHRQRVREPPARTGADVQHRPAAERHSGARTHSGVLHPRRLEDIGAVDAQSGVSIHAEFSIDRDQWPDRRVQPADAAARLSGKDPVRPLKKNNFGPRFGAVYRLTDRRSSVRATRRIWIEMAGITTPFTTPNFPFLQDVSLRTLDNIAPAFVLKNGPTVTPVGCDANAGLGQGVFTVDRDLGSGYAQQWNVSVQRELTTNTVVEVSYLGSKITNIGIPDSNINQLTEEQLKLGSTLLERIPNPLFGTIPRSSSIGDPTVTRAQLMKPYPEYTAVSFYRNNVGTTDYQGLSFSIRQRTSRGLTYSAAYTRSKLTDIASSVFDASILTGPVTNAAVADSHNLERDRDYSTGDIPHYFGASVVWDVPFGTGRASNPGGLLGVLAKDWSVAAVMTLQSGVPGGGDAVELARVRRLHDAAAKSGRRSNAAGERADTRPLVQHLGVRVGRSIHDRICLS